MTNTKRILCGILIMLLIIILSNSLVSIPVNITISDIENISIPLNTYNQETDFEAYYENILSSTYFLVDVNEVIYDEVTMVINVESKSGDVEQYIRYGEKYLLHYYNDKYLNAYAIPKIVAISDFVSYIMA